MSPKVRKPTKREPTAVNGGRRRFLAVSAAAGAVASAPMVLRWPSAKAKRARRPNIVLVVVDDMRLDEYSLGDHTFLETPNIDALAQGGAQFTEAYHTTPLCSPNRASILTGQYASRHGILDNTSRARSSHQLATFARVLQPAGYETAHVGKWHMGNDPTPRPGYDYWVSFRGQGHTNDPELFEDGRLHKVEGYVTDIFTDRAVDFIRRRRDRPFALTVAHKAIHPEIQQRDDGSVDLTGGKRFIPAARHMGRYEGKSFKRRPNYGLTDEVRRNKPVLAAAMDIKNSPEITDTFGPEVLDGLIPDNTIQRRAEMMLAVDEGLGRMIEALDDTGQRRDTLVIFMSDNGYFFGEHGLSIERRMPYEEGIKTPLIISWPAAFEDSREIADFALSIDIAPTIVAAAGLAVPDSMQGRSLIPPLLGDNSDWRDSFLIEYYGHDNPFPWLVNMDYRAVRMGNYKYIRWIRQGDADELYDLSQDPYEMRNMADDAAFGDVVHAAQVRMADLVLDSMGLEPDSS